MLVGDESILLALESQRTLAHPVAEWKAAQEHVELDQVQKQLPGVRPDLRMPVMRRGQLWHERQQLTLAIVQS